MSAKKTIASKASFLNPLSLFSSRKKARRAAIAKRLRKPRTLQLEGLEDRQMFSVNSLGFSGSTLVVKTDNASTSVTVSQVGNSIRVTEDGSNRNWDYQASKVGKLEFQGGAGNDRFVNNVVSLNTRAFGGAGNDYLEGYNGVDEFIGGDGNDTLIGYGGNDLLWGGNGNDLLRGMNGNDQLVGDAGDDYMDGGAGDDGLWGYDGSDTLLGGDGNDQLVGGNGNDHLNGQAGSDKMWGEAGDDVLISLDGAFGEYVDSGLGADTMWIDRVGSSRDNVIGQTSIDMVQEVSGFANGADRTLNGDNLSDPIDSGLKVQFTNNISAGNTHGSNPLFSNNGPSMNDVTQGAEGDCWLLAGLSAIGMDSPHTLQQNVVDFDDGTYGVHLGNGFYRVDNELPAYNTQLGATANNLRFASLGAENSMWVAVVEKAFADYRTGAHSYASLNGGWSVEVNRAFHSTSSGAKNIRSYSNAAALANDIANRFNTYQAVTIGFVGALSGNVPLIANHMYTVASIQRNSAGAITSITLRNPHGNHTSQFTTFVTLTAAQLYAQTGQVNWGHV